jgi:hypothetical protein
MPSLNTKLASAPNTTSNYVLRATSSTTIGNSTIQDDGTNVAIGTTPGTYKLNVSGTGNFTGALSGTSATFTSSVAVGGATNTLGFLEVWKSGSSIAQLSIGQNATYHTDFFIDASGNFYVQPQGTTRLTIASTGAATFTGNNSSNTTENASVSWNDSNGNLMGRIVGYRGANGNDGNLRFYTSNTPTLAMTITSGGNVGIGTSSPAYPLDIYSATSPATIGLKTDGQYNSVFRDYTTTTSSYLDITTERTDGGAFNFLLLVSSTLIASAGNRNYYTFAVQGRGTTGSATQLSNVSAGTSSRTSISVSFPSNGVIRLTVNSGESCQLKVTAMGHGAL